MRISDWSSDVCSSDLGGLGADRLISGTGADLFVFRPGEVAGDSLVDFDAAAGDRMEFRDFGSGARLEHVSGEPWSVVHARGEEHFTISVPVKPDDTLIT